MSTSAITDQLRRLSGSTGETENGVCVWFPQRNTRYLIRYLTARGASQPETLLPLADPAHRAQAPEGGRWVPDTCKTFNLRAAWAEGGTCCPCHTHVPGRPNTDPTWLPGLWAPNSNPGHPARLSGPCHLHGQPRR